MSKPFASKGRGIEGHLGRVDVAILSGLLEELLQLLEPEEPVVDPLEQLTGISSRPIAPPSSPVVRRLLPDGYADAADAAEFRRVSELDLREIKRDNARWLLGALPRDGGRFRMDLERAEAVLTVINDLRLALGTALEVTDDDHPSSDDLAEDDPLHDSFLVYEWLGWLQWQLLSTLAP